MNRLAALSTLIAALLVHTPITAKAALHAVGAPSAKIEQLFKDSRSKSESKAGRNYMDQFLKAVDSALLPAMTACTKNTPDTVEPGMILFVIGADGRAKQLLFSKEVPMAQCVAERLGSVGSLPKPPADNWIEGVGVANHSKEEQARSKAPKDKPTGGMTGERLAAYDKAIAPYIAKARASYPVAKKRFLAGLPVGYHFSVRVPLHDGNKREDSFVAVEKISDGKITGQIQSTLDVVENYKTGQRITFPEADIDNWVIVRPDGSEEGNVVGKFLDTYHP